MTVRLKADTTYRRLDGIAQTRNTMPEKNVDKKKQVKPRKADSGGNMGAGRSGKEGRPVDERLGAFRRSRSGVGQFLFRNGGPVGPPLRTLTNPFISVTVRAPTIGVIGNGNRSPGRCRFGVILRRFCFALERHPRSQLLRPRNRAAIAQFSWVTRTLCPITELACQ
jgi:hypothetical protein